MTGSFDVFLSHNSQDKPTVRQLAQALQARGLQVWLDEEQLVPGRPWQEALEDIIQTARTATVLVGKVISGKDCTSKPGLGYSLALVRGA